MNDPEITDSNQTYFGHERPLFETPTSNQLPPPPPDPSLEKPVPWYRKPIVLAGVGAAVILVLVLIVLLLRRPEVAEMLPQPSSTPTPVPANLTPYQQRVQSLNTELKAADPTKPELPFPPVNLGLRLDPVRR